MCSDPIKEKTSAEIDGFSSANFLEKSVLFRHLNHVKDKKCDFYTI